MRRQSYSLKLMREVTQFARDNRVYWMVPLFVVVGLTGLLIVGTQVIAPLIYALF